MKNSFVALRFVKPHICELIHSSASLVVFFPVLACVLSCTYRDKPSWQGQLVCAGVDNQWSRGVVIARLQSSVRSLLHQYQDFHQSTYFYLAEDRELTSHQVVSDFRLPVRYFCVLYSLFLSLYHAPSKKPKKIIHFPLSYSP
jgi:hypothetical protein